MNEILVEHPRLTQEGNLQRLSAVIKVNGTEKTLWFRLPAAVPVSTCGDPFLIALLTTAMSLNTNLRVKASISNRLAKTLPRIQSIFNTWYPGFTVVPVVIDQVSESSNSNTNHVASFFSGGVDSFFTAIMNHDRISSLILVHGFDFPLNNLELRQKISTSVRSAAQMLGKNLIEIETNSREITEPHASWPLHQHGAALASVAAVLGESHDRVLIPSTETYSHMRPRGSNALVDPLWSTDQVSIEHDGAETDRDGKVEQISATTPAMKYLRVCWRNPDNTYNCGKCEKCLRTMISLLIVEALEKCETFPNQLDPKSVAAIRIPTDPILIFLESSLEKLKKNGKHPDIVRSLASTTSHYRANKLGREMAAITQLPGTSELLNNAIEKHRDVVINILVKKAPLGVIKSLLKSMFRMGK